MFPSRLGVVLIGLLPGLVLVVASDRRFTCPDRIGSSAESTPSRDISTHQKEASGLMASVLSCSALSSLALFQTHHRCSLLPSKDSFDTTYRVEWPTEEHNSLPIGHCSLLYII